MKPSNAGLHREGEHSDRPPQGAHDPSAPQRVPRRQRERLRHRAELIEATERLLAVKPLSELTVQDIAAESEFSVGYIYKLFDGKDDILATFLREKLSQLRAIIQENTSAPGAWDDRTQSLLTAISAWLERTPAYGSKATLHLKVFARSHPGAAADLASFVEFYRHSIEVLFSEPIRAEHLRERTPGDIASTFRALVAGLVEESLMQHGDDTTLADQAPLVVEVLKRAFASKGGGV